MTIFGSGAMIGGPLAGWLTDHYGGPWSFWVQVGHAGSDSFSVALAYDS